LYILRILEVESLVLLLTSVNFVTPSILVMSIFYLKCKFSGIPKRDEYKSRLRKLNWVVALWSFARLIRAISSIWDVNLFFGMMLEMNKPSKAEKAEEIKDMSSEDTDPKKEDGGVNLAAPMTLIVIFLVVEIWPIWLVLDGNFVDIFLKYSVLIE